MNRVSDMMDFVRKRVGTVADDIILRELNLAWSAIWTAEDLPNCFQTILIKPSSGDRWMSLPGFVDRIQGIRYASWGPTIKLNYPTTYFNGQGPRWQNLLEWRSVDVEAVKRQIDIVAPVTLTTAAPLSADVEVTIIGEGAGSGRLRETVTLPAGERTVTSSKSFGPTITSITKKVYTESDITVSDSAGNELAVLGSAELETRFVVVKLHDCCDQFINLNCQCFEVLYKTRPPVLWFEEDTVPTPHHNAVQAAATASILASKSGDGDLKRAAAYAQQAQMATSKFTQNELRGTDTPVITGGNPLITRWNNWI